MGVEGKIRQILQMFLGPDDTNYSYDCIGMDNYPLMVGDDIVSIQKQTGAGQFQLQM